MRNRIRTYLHYAKLCLLVARYRINYHPTSKIKYLFLSWHHNEKMPMYLTMDFKKTESMGGEVWSDQFFPIFNRKSGAHDDYLNDQVTQVAKYLDPEQLHTTKQKIFYYIVFGHIASILKQGPFIIVNQRNKFYIDLLAPYLAIKFPQAKIVIQYIDSVELDKIANIDEYKQYDNCEIYSFDRKDVNNYRLKYYSWYVDDKRLLEYSQATPKYDIQFIGEDKGKVAELKRIEKILDKHGMTHHWHVVFSEEFEASIGVKKDKSFKYMDEYLSTFDYQKKYAESKVILEILQEGQFGPTLDLANSVFLRRKLITNNTDVVNEACYDKQNIFIIGKDDISQLKQFVESPYKVLPKSTTEKYTYEYMLQQLDKGSK